MLGIDLAKAFNNISRLRAIKVMRMFLNEDDMRMVHIVLTSTTLRVKFKDAYGQYFRGNTGTPEGGSLSPIIFTIYVQAIIFELLQEIQDQQQKDELLWFIFADDVDVMNRIGGTTTEDDTITLIRKTFEE
jgi:hypothetical protein